MLCSKRSTPVTLLALSAAVLAPIALAEAGSLEERDVRFQSRHLDRTADPCADFYRFANGGWLDSNPIPPDRSRWSAYDQVAAIVELEIAELLHAAARERANNPPGSAPWKLGLLYSSCMDAERRAREEDQALSELLSLVEQAFAEGPVSRALGRLHRVGLDVPFSLSTIADPDDSSRRILQVWQNGLGLPVASWYSLDGEQATELRRAYVAVIERALRHAGFGDEAVGLASDVLEFETGLAAAAMEPSDTRDPSQVTNRLTAAELQALGAEVDWEAYFTAVGLSPPEQLIVAQPEYLKWVTSRAHAEPARRWRAYFSWHLVRRLSKFMVGDLSQVSQELARLYSGTSEPPPLERRCGEFADFAMGEVIGDIWARERFQPAAKDYAEAMAADLVAAMQARILEIDWMSAKTRDEALSKLKGLEIRIGYPEKPPDHSGLQLDPAASFVDHVVAVSRFRFAADLARLNEPVDDSWGLLPQWITGGYSPSQNVIEFPAAKFRPPFFALDRDDALNYGALGAVLAHEILHALDDEGRRYDAAGNLRDWWTEADASAFNERAERLVKQFDGYTVLDGKPVDGRLTLGENIADLGGVSLAWNAFKRRSIEGDEEALIDGMTSSQRFFLGWAIAFRGHLRPERQRSALERDVHSPLKWRVNGVMKNLPAFAEAFGCEMPADNAIVRIW